MGAPSHEFEKGYRKTLGSLIAYPRAFCTGIGDADLLEIIRCISRMIRGAEKNLGLLTYSIVGGSKKWVKYAHDPQGEFDNVLVVPVAVE
jgi:hypothetical protein